ncbi:hypothetical protein NHJ13051_008920 [Beauveria bassiana]
MYIVAKPNKARNPEDKEEMNQKYQPGDQVIPHVTTRERTAEERRAEEEDRRLVDEVREMSLREAEGGVPSVPPRRRRGSRAAEERISSRRARDDGRARRGTNQLGLLNDGHRRRRSESQQRQVGHQSSLRSLISSADLSERDIEREIEEFARQIQEEGLLDGLDLDNIDLTRDDELSRRITEAYRRRQRGRATAQPTRRDSPTTRNEANASTRNGDGRLDPRPRPLEIHSPSRSREGSSSRPATGSSSTEERDRRPPRSLEVRDPQTRPRRRTASDSRAATLPVVPTELPVRPAARSSTDLTLPNERTASSTLRPNTSGVRSSSVPSAPAELPASNATTGSSFASRLGRPSTTPNDPPRAAPDQPRASTDRPRASTDRPRASSASRPNRAAELAIIHSAATTPAATSPVPSGHRRTMSQLYPEPSITCMRCNKTHIEYEIHYNCGICAGGHWSMCSDCYRSGKGCQYWFGFGHGGWNKWRRRRQQRGDDSMAPPHILTPSRYQPPPSTPGGADGRKTLTMDDPQLRLESGTFCANCTSSLVENAAPGDYDICSPCYADLVNSGRVSAENGHYGWRRCLKGHRMVVIGFAPGEVGHWRFIERDLVGGRKLRIEPVADESQSDTPSQKWSWKQEDQKLERLVTQEVSATAPNSDDSVTYTTLFPPDGGVGLRVSAKWAWFPREEADDELLFPRGAEIREVEDVNGDWYFGVYMGAKGQAQSVPRNAGIMFRITARRLAAAAAAAAEPSAHTLKVSQAQGVANGLTAAIGNTPLIRLHRLSEETGCDILGKAEFMNPGGSIKDRAALYVVKDAEERGLLRAGGTVVEGTAGNTGIGLAHVCRSRGYRLVIYMPNTQSQGKIDLLRLLGAEVHPVPAVAFENPENYNHQARRHAERLDNAVWTNQFDNTANRRAHIETTGPEIWAQTAGAVDAFTCATGTAGTLAGVTRYLKDVSGGRVRSFLADPPGSVLHSYIASGGKLNERSGSSITEGIGQGRVTDNLQPDIDLLDGSMTISDEKSIEMVYRCLDEEGLYLGASSALNVVAAKEVAEKLGKGHKVVTVLCDGAYRYADRLFSRKWLTDKKLIGAIPKHLEKYIVLA